MLQACSKCDLGVLRRVGNEMRCDDCGWIGVRTLIIRKLLPWEHLLWKITYGTRWFETAFMFLYKRQEKRVAQ